MPVALAGNDSLVYFKKAALPLMESAPDKAMPLLNKGLQLSRNHSDEEHIAWFAHQKAGLFIRFNDTTKAIQYLQESIQSYERTKNNAGFAHGLLMLGSLTQNRRHLQKALRIYRNDENLPGLARSYLKMQHHFQTRQNDLMALAYSDSTLAAGSHSKTPVYGESILARANLYFSMGDQELLRSFVKSYIDSAYLTPMQRDQLELIMARSELLEPATHQNAVDRLHSLLENERLNSAQELEAAVLLASAMEAAGNEAVALKYLEKADSLRLFIREGNKENLVKLLESEYNSRIQGERIERMNAELDQEFYVKLILAGILGMTLVFSIIIYLQQRSRLSKKRTFLENKKLQAQADKQLIESQLAHRKLQEELLNREIESKKMDLSGFAETFVQHNDVLKKLQGEINLLKRATADSRRREKIGELSMTLLQLAQRDVPRKHILNKTLHIDDEVLFQLQQKFPKLTEQDMELLVFIISKVDSEEIAAIYNIEKGSLMTKRYRLRKKLGMASDETFDEFMNREIKWDVQV